MNETINNSEKKSIPEFKKLEDILECKNCKKDCKCNPNKNNRPDTPSSKKDCKRVIGIISIVEIIIGIVIETILITLSFLVFHSAALCVLLAILCIAIMFYFNEKFTDEIIEKKFITIEKERQSKYDEEVQKIKMYNEIIERQERGETEEYISFKNHADKVTGEIFDFLSGFSDNNFIEFVSSLKNLNLKISPDNFEYVYIQTFYNIHLPSLSQNIQTYWSKCSEDKSTIREDEAFEKLLYSFNKRIAQIIEGLEEDDEKRFIKKLNVLNVEIYNLDYNPKEKLE